MHPYSRVYVTEWVTLKSRTHNWVKFKTATRGIVHVESIQKLYESHICPAGNGISEARRDVPFRILLAKFSAHPRDLRIGQKVAKLDTNPSAIVEPGMTHADMLASQQIYGG